MNKKFSTLMASLLLVGSAFSTATAQKIADAANDGKYYKIVRTASWTKDPDVWAADVTGKIYLNAAGDGIVKNGAADAGIYAIAKAGEDKYSLKTYDGKTLTVGGNTVFTVKSYDGNILNNTVGGDLLWITENSVFVGSDGNADQKLTLVSTAGPSEQYPGVWGYAVQTVATNLEEVKDYNANGIKDGYTFRFVIQTNGNVEMSDDMYKAVVNKTTGTVSFVEIGSGKALEIDGASNFTRLEVGNDVVLKVSANSFVKYDGTNFSLVSSLEEATILAFEATGSDIVRVDQLNFFSQNGFSVTIKGAATNGKFTVALEGNPFTGHLTPMAYNDGGNGSFGKADGDATEFYLKNADGKYIVAQRYSGEGATAAQALYKFVTVDSKALIENLKRAAAGLEDMKYFGVFRADASEAVITEDAETLQYIDHLQVVVDGGAAKVGRYDFSGKPTLAASIATNLKDIQIKLGSSKLVDVKKFLQKGKFYTIERVTPSALSGNGKVVAAGFNYVDYVTSYGNVLEGQFAATYDEATETITFRNRENPNTIKTFNAHALYVVDGKADTYRYGNETSQRDEDNNELTAVYTIKAVASHAASDGYVTLPQTNTNRLYNIAYSSAVFGNSAYMTENHADDTATKHIIGLDPDVDNALQFTAKEWSKAAYTERQADHTDWYYPTDSVYVISNLGYWDADEEDYLTTQDTLKVVTYSFVNQWGEALTFDGSKLYSTKNSVTSANPHAYAVKFALRKDGDKLNLRQNWFDRGVQKETVSFDDTKNYQVLTGQNKVYAGDAAEGILSEIGLYSRTENDLFVVEETSKAIYRSLEGANANGLDTISIYRDENNKSLLYEKAVTLTADNNKVVNFLGMENIADFTEMAPAMLADTAYVRNETYMPQYLLVVNPTIVPAGKWCDVHQTADCEHAVPTKGLVSGRFLVSLQDTADVWADANKHKAGNPYLNSEGYAKLGFVQATHYNDTLAITRVKPTKADSLYLGNNDFNAAKFAFKYVDTESKSFLIETKGGFLKWMNGYVVVVPNEKNADIFNLNEDEDRNPTANEAIAAEGVQVVAGKGVVTVQGAAGKVITVANILGQTIANQVAASDNVTIAVPAGIVVVAVEGEATKVVVK